MPVKLQVTKKDANGGEPADYLFEQDRITIGRGSNNDLTLPDQKVSTEHAEIRMEEGTYLLFDRESKNKTYVDGQRVGETEPYTLQSGDVFQVGDFKIEFAPLFMPSSEQTAYADTKEEENPFDRHVRQLASALEGLAETYKFVPAEQRDEEFAAAVETHLDETIGDEEAVRQVLRAVDAGDRGGGRSTPSTGSPGRASTTATDDEAVMAVLETLLECVSRLIRIPNYFWSEFTGDTLVHPPDKEFLYGGDAEDLERQLLGDGVSATDRKERLRHLREAADSLVAHNTAMLTGYKKSVVAGSKKLLQRVNPLQAVDEVEEGGVMGGFLGGGSSSELENLVKKWRELTRESGVDIESELFRPVYVEAYVDRMADTWDLDKADIMAENGG